MTVAIVHDHLLHRGGSERVLVSMHRAFPNAPIYTAFFDSRRTFPELAGLDIFPLSIDRVRAFHRNHRLAFPFLASAFSRLTIDADVVLCSSSGWAHGVRTDGRKIVYCHSPANWLYRSHHYMRSDDVVGKLAARLLQHRLERWDKDAAQTAQRYLANSSFVAGRIQDIYGIHAKVIPPPHTIDPDGPQRPLQGIERGFFLNVSRLVPHKNVDAILHAFRGLPTERLVVVGSGPEARRLRALAPHNVVLVGTVDDPALRWLYSNCHAVLAASYEDFGLTPLEAASFGKPAITLKWGGFLDTVIEGLTGFFFEKPDPRDIATAINHSRSVTISAATLKQHAGRYSEASFVERLERAVLS